MSGETIKKTFFQSKKKLKAVYWRGKQRSSAKKERYLNSTGGKGKKKKKGQTRKPISKRVKEKRKT